MNYYYFAATLPAVSMAAEPAWSVAAFVAAAERQLAADDRRELLALLDGHGSSAFARRERDHRHVVAVLAARQRAGRRGNELPPEEEGVPDVALRNAVQDAFLAADPLERQRRLDAVRWTFLDGVRRQAPFSIESIFAYALQLQLAWQWQPRTETRGEAALGEQRQRLLAVFSDLQFTIAGETSK